MVALPEDRISWLSHCFPVPFNTSSVVLLHLEVPWINQNTSINILVGYKTKYMYFITTNKYMLFFPMKIVWDIIHCATFQCIDETPPFWVSSTLLFQSFVKNRCIFVTKIGKLWLSEINSFLFSVFASRNSNISVYHVSFIIFLLP